ncbi:MAG TPA: OmcA/MtrC family decaheme c-type cytochrome [Ramlibacter sp.]|uniref:OmcA/MtrC family decaheme c-type cytochrome n=1 Tax=Ramlibacter sp. TaxID=1917967 RepID=UPI002BB0A609|nr:OmcA/MtrC family decaheme c-type cytochrome [Ramlibacter sp.]HVZ43699.1 OmcA/MtrC family decaheme c-type cytochrome [Ramlibacter sp.]
MERISRRLAALVLGTAALLAGCGGGGGGGGETAPAPQTVAQALQAAAAQAANDTSANSSSAFAVLQAAGVPAVTVASPPKVNFAVFSNGQLKKDLTLANMSFAIAKLVPGASGDPDQWVNYIYRTETAAAGVGPGGNPVLATAKQATTDAKQTDPALMAQQLVVNADGYYTYTFKTDITNPANTNGVVYEPNRTHRIAIQLSYTDSAGNAVKVNPYFDFTLDATGKSVAVTDPSKTRKVADVQACNGCHDKLSLHGGGRIDVQFCVMCHNPGTTDANSGNVLTLSTMAHKIHSGKLLKQAFDQGKGGEEYAIWGFGNQKVDFTDVGFPQDLRNCTSCHTATNPATPQGDVWKSKPSKEACLTCHANKAGSDWDTSHKVFAGTLVGAGAAAKDMTNQMCANCHKPGSNISPERVHWNQNEENAAKYKMNIDSLAYDSTARKVTIKYFLSDPTNGNAAYNLVTSDCAAGPPVSCSTNTRFGNLRLFLAYQNMVGQSQAVTEYTSYNNGGSGAAVYAYAGTNDGSNHYTATISVPPDTTTSVAFGTARVVSIGQVKEHLLDVKSATDPRPEVVPTQLVNVVVQNAWKELALTGALNPRREIVSTEKCNVCHGALGTTSGSNTLSEAFHGGARNIVQACVVCHDPNRMSSTVMTNGLAFNESYQFKRMIHGIHGNSKRTYPFTHGNVVQGAFDDSGTLTTTGQFLSDYKVTVGTGSVTAIPAGTSVAAGNTFDTIADIMKQAATGVGYTGTPAAPAENYGAEVMWPGMGIVSGVSINCNACHVNNSYKQDLGPVGSVIGKPAGVTDPNQWLVISPKAASCTACHDSPQALGHVTSFGGATWGNRTQAQVNALPREICADCHSSGGFKGVDIVHGQN